MTRTSATLFVMLALLTSCKDGGPSSSGAASDAGASQTPIPAPTPGSGLPIPSPTPRPSVTPAPILTPTPTQPPNVVSGRRMEIITGNGQGMMSFWSFGRPFVVKVTDTNGRAVSNTAVRFETLDNPGAISYRTNEVLTNADGIASLEVRSGTLNANSNGFATTRAFLPGVTPAVEVQFYTLCTPQNSSGFLLPLYNLNHPQTLETLTMRRGQTLPSAISYSFAHAVSPFAGQAIPNMGFQVSIVDPDADAFTPYDPLAPTAPDLPTAECVGRTALSNARGVAECDLKVTGGNPGRYTLRVELMGATATKNIYLQLDP